MKFLQRVIVVGIILSLLLIASSAMATTKFFDTNIYNGPSQIINSGTKSSDTVTSFEVTRAVHSGTFTYFSFRVYWGNEPACARKDFTANGKKTATYYTSSYNAVFSDFVAGEGITLKGSVPQKSDVYCKVTCGLYWNY